MGLPAHFGEASIVSEDNPKTGTRKTGTRKTCMRKAWGKTAGRLLASMVIATLVLASTTSQPASAQVPGAEWERVSSADQSPACHAALAQAQTQLESSATTALVAVRDGRILFSYGPIAQPSIVESVRKSILVMLYGRYVADGTIPLDRTLGDLGIDDIGGLLPIEKNARVRDLLSSRSAVYHPAANAGDDLAAAPARGSQQPGTYFLYNNWGFNAAGTVFEQATGRDIYDAFVTDLATPLQLQDFERSRHVRGRFGDKTRSSHPPYHFFLSTRDMARIGTLMLEHGRWQGVQVLPAGWADTITTPITPAADMHPRKTAAYGLGYGDLWWTFEEPAGSPLEGAFMAWGTHGQFILVAPKRNMVIAHKRLIAPSGNEPATRVGKDAFLAVARLLLDAPCP